MNKGIAILATGDELISGEVVNSNCAHIAKICWDHQLPLGMQMTVGDRQEDIEEAARYLLAGHQGLITLGGLGPTSDDRTRFAIAKTLKRSLSFCDEMWQRIEKRYYEKKQSAPPNCNKQQAMRIEDALVMPNPNGTAAGQYIRLQQQSIALLPGPPNECLPMMEDHLLPLLLKDMQTDAHYRRRWQLNGKSESVIADLLDPLVKDKAVTLGYRSYKPHLDIKLASKDKQLFEQLCQQFDDILDKI